MLLNLLLQVHEMDKIPIIINQMKKWVPKNSLLTEVLQTETLPTLFAIAVNGQFVPKAHYFEYQLQCDDSIAILTPMQGG